jgi:hypothetical protein
MTRRDAHRIPAGEAVITKQILRGLPEEALMRDPAPLDAIYLLTPTRADGGVAATRERVAPVRAAVSLVEHAKSGALLGKSEAPALFGRAVGVARQVPVFQLTVYRDLTRLDDVAAQLVRWHRGAAA